LKNKCFKGDPDVDFNYGLIKAVIDLDQEQGNCHFFIYQQMILSLPFENGK
jgi:hypothetical protein